MTQPAPQRIRIHCSSSVRWLTIVVLTVIAVASYFGLQLFLHELSAASVDGIGNALLSALGLLILWSAVLIYAPRMPRYYILDESGLTLGLLCGRKYFPRKEYEIASEVDASEVAGLSRLVGTGGVCGYLGSFSVPDRGTCTLYLTSLQGHLFRLRHRHTGRYTYITQRV